MAPYMSWAPGTPPVTPYDSILSSTARRGHFSDKSVTSRDPSLQFQIPTLPTLGDNLSL